MTDYVVGDIQGCLDPLLRLLDRVNFEPATDRLLAVGDLVNRGPKSLETLRFCKGLGNSFSSVLGNHDLHLLAISHKVRPASSKDTLNSIFNASDSHELLDWLQQLPLLISLGDYTLVHAGIPPIGASRPQLAWPGKWRPFFNRSGQQTIFKACTATSLIAGRMSWKGQSAGG